MANIEDVLGQGIDDQNFNIDIHQVVLLSLRYHVKTTLYLEEIMKKQYEIKDVLQHGKVDDQRVDEALRAKLELLHEEINKEFLHAIASSTAG
jgi:hypothetical protein